MYHLRRITFTMKRSRWVNRHCKATHASIPPPPLMLDEAISFAMAQTHST
jgi:hypothetical protein